MKNNTGAGVRNFVSRSKSQTNRRARKSSIFRRAHNAISRGRRRRFPRTIASLTSNFLHAVDDFGLIRKRHNYFQTRDIRSRNRSSLLSLSIGLTSKRDEALFFISLPLLTLTPYSVHFLALVFACIHCRFPLTVFR
jgi:hypothetical protein